MGKAADNGGGIARLELLETAAVDNAGDDLSWVDELVEVDGREAIKVVRVI